MRVRACVRVCVCVCARAGTLVCVRECVHACVHSLLFINTNDVTLWVVVDVKCSPIYGNVCLVI